MYLVRFICILCFFCQVDATAQIRGCTDENANNYNISAELNDGSCTYDITNYTPINICPKLSDTIIESSGLIYYNGLFWTINDSNNPPFLYAFDSTSGRILHQTYIVNQVNNDWEDLSHDSLYIYVGDFGNNRGDRKNLNILKIRKSEINLSHFTDTVVADMIRFEMKDQINFNNTGQNHDYDMEAFCIIEDSIHLFSKNWVDGRSRHYICPKDTGFYSLEPLESFYINGQITGACYGHNKTIVLTGYNKASYASFIYLMWDHKNNRFQNGNKRRIEIGNILSPGQNEALCFRNQILYLSNEKQVSNAQLYRLHIKQWVEKTNQSSVSSSKIKTSIRVIVKSSVLQILCSENDLKKTITVYDSSGRSIKSFVISNKVENVEIGDLKSGIYMLFADKVFIKKIIIN